MTVGRGSAGSNRYSLEGAGCGRERAREEGTELPGAPGLLLGDFYFNFSKAVAPSLQLVQLIPNQGNSKILFMECIALQFSEE